MTANNDYTKAYIEIAKELGDKKLVKAFEDIAEVQKKKGQLPHDLSDERYKLYQKMLKKAKAKFINYKDVYQST